MASVKIATLLIRTIAKPIANRLKHQAEQHDSFRKLCIGLAQWSHRSEVRLRTGLLGESPKAIRPLNDTKAIQNGANSLAEGFLFAVAASVILAESWRSSRNDSKRRDLIDDSLEGLQAKIEGMNTRIDNALTNIEQKLEEQQTRSDDMSRILEQVMQIGLRSGWAQLDDDRRSRLSVPILQDALTWDEPESPQSGSSTGNV